MVRRRADGYHDLESIFLPIPLCDELEMTPADTFSFQQEGIAIGGTPEDNLVVRAYRLMEQYAVQPVQPMAIRLRKNIPFGAGLGGGSSDAAFALKMLNDLWRVHLTDNELQTLAKQLGADCPFFIANQPTYVTGIGDQLETLEGNPITGYRLVLVKPDTAVSTAEAYRDIVPRNRRESFSDCDLRKAIRQPMEQWRDSIVNDFESTVFTSHPELTEIKKQLYNAGALYASMSGSGAALFALFPNESQPCLDNQLKQITLLS